MKKRFLLSLAVFIGSFLYGQSELYNTDWSLKKVIINNITYNLPQNTEIGTPILTFSPTPNTPPPPGSTTNMSSPICGANIWGIMYDNEITANSFTFWSLVFSGPTNCTMPENITFSNQYAEYFSMGFINYNYQITYSGGVKNLIITNELGDQVFYQYGTLGTKENKAQLPGKMINIYPNPVKEGFVHLKNAERIEWIKVYNTEGKLIIQEHSSDSKINVSNLLKGGYFMEVKSQSGISRHKFIKE